MSRIPPQHLLKPAVIAVSAAIPDARGSSEGPFAFAAILLVVVGVAAAVYALVPLECLFSNAQECRAMAEASPL